MSKYVRHRGRVTGPHSPEQLALMARRGVLGRAHEVSDDAVNWYPATTLDQLFKPTGPPPPMQTLVFVSHSSKDKPAADAVVAYLERSGIPCWIAPRDILPGATWASSIMKGIGDARAMVLIFSEHANASKHVCSEVERAVFHSIPVAPVRIRDIKPQGDLEFFLSRAHWMDAIAPPFHQHLEQLSKKLRQLLELPAQEPLEPTVEPVAADPANRRKLLLWIGAGVVAVAIIVGGILLARGSHPARPPATPVHVRHQQTLGDEADK